MLERASTTSFDEHHVHAVIHRIHHRLGYDRASPPFSTTAIFRALFPDIEITCANIREHAKIEVYSEPLPTGTRALITYREKAHHSTQRFSLMHELAHWIFDFNVGRFDGTALEALRCRGSAGEVKHVAERRADYFAAEALCPLYRLDPYVDFAIHTRADDTDGQHVREQSIHRLASTFNLSTAAMKRRVFDLAAWRRISRGR